MRNSRHGQHARDHHCSYEASLLVRHGSTAYRVESVGPVLRYAPLASGLYVKRRGDVVSFTALVGSEGQESAPVCLIGGPRAEDVGAHLAEFGTNVCAHKLSIRLPCW